MVGGNKTLLKVYSRHQISVYEGEVNAEKRILNKLFLIWSQHTVSFCVKTQSVN